MRDKPQVPSEVVERLRAICVAFPEVVEEPAWIGQRWRVSGKTFAHVAAIADGWPPAYVRAAGTAGPACVLTFESSGDELEVLSLAQHPFFKPPWRRTVIGLFIDDETDWTEVAELVTESYCVQAPKRLSAAVDRPDALDP
jgi:hypothetical protein